MIADEGWFDPNPVVYPGTVQLRCLKVLREPCRETGPDPFVPERADGCLAAVGWPYDRRQRMVPRMPLVPGDVLEPGVVALEGFVFWYNGLMASGK